MDKGPKEVKEGIKTPLCETVSLKYKMKRVETDNFEKMTQNKEDRIKVKGSRERARDLQGKRVYSVTETKNKE